MYEGGVDNNIPANSEEDANFEDVIDEEKAETEFENNLEAMFMGKDEVDLECKIRGWCPSSATDRYLFEEWSDRTLAFKLAEIRRYTQDFNLSISGGDSQVYRGVISGRVDNEGLNGKEIVVKAWLRIRERNRKSWRREVVLLAKFKGEPHIIELIGKCSTSKRLFLVLPFYKRGDLERNISDPDLKSDQALDILEGIAKVINKLHSRTPPVLYRDLKLGNVLLRDNFSPVLTDFETVGTAPRITGGGTPGYREHDFAQTGFADKKSDVFAFGILMLLVLMKTNLVFDKDGVVKKQAYELMEEAKASREFVFHPSLGDKYSEDLKRLCDLAIRCLTGVKDPRGDTMIVEGSSDSSPDMREILRTIQQTRQNIERQKIAEGKAVQRDEGTSSHHQATQRDEGTSTHHQAAHPDEGTSSRSSDHQITQTQPVIPIEPPQIVRDETQIPVQERSTQEQFGPLYQWMQNAFPCFACFIAPRPPPEPEQ